MILNMNIGSIYIVPVAVEKDVDLTSTCSFKMNNEEFNYSRFDLSLWIATPQELMLASFHELAKVNNLAEALNASLIVRLFFEGYTRHFRQNFIRICEVKQTLTTGIHESS